VVGKGGTPFPSHLTIEGFNKILAIRASMNKGLPLVLK